MITYHQIAIQDLKDAGISVASLIKQYPQELMRFKLACDMGMTDIELKADEPGSHPLNRAAEAWIELATTWPPQEAIAGIAVPALDKAIVFQVSEGIDVLAQLPLSHHTEAVRLSAVQKDGWALQYIPADQQSEVVRLAAVHKNGRAIEFIPAANLSEEVCLAAVQRNSLALKCIPIDQQSEAIRLAAIHSYGWALQYIPADQQSEAVRIAAVQKNSWALKFIPAVQQSEAVRLAAVRWYGRALEYIPIDQQSKAVRVAALKRDKSSEMHMPPEIAKQLLAELDADAGFSR
jgi:hypothetical protein